MFCLRPQTVALAEDGREAAKAPLALRRARLSRRQPCPLRQLAPARPCHLKRVHPHPHLPSVRRRRYPSRRVTPPACPASTAPRKAAAQVTAAAVVPRLLALAAPASAPHDRLVRRRQREAPRLTRTRAARSRGGPRGGSGIARLFLALICALKERMGEHHGCGLN